MATGGGARGKRRTRKDEQRKRRIYERKAGLSTGETETGAAVGRRGGGERKRSNETLATSNK